MTEIKVGPQRKMTSIAVELISAKRYVYYSKVYQAGYVYNVSKEDSEVLLEDLNDRGMPYFRPVIGEKAQTAIAPPAKALATKKKNAAKKVAARRAVRGGDDADDEGIEIA